MARELFWVGVEFCFIQFHVFIPFALILSIKPVFRASDYYTLTTNCCILFTKTLVLLKVKVDEWMRPGLCACAFWLLFRWSWWRGRLTLTEHLEYCNSSLIALLLILSNKIVASKIKGLLSQAQPQLHLSTQTDPSVVLSISVLSSAFTVFQCICKCCTPNLLKTMLHSILYLTFVNGELLF